MDKPQVRAREPRLHSMPYLKRSDEGRAPGVMVRSITTSPSGAQAGGTAAFVSGHDSPLEQRWGGWYVTGATSQRHMGKTTLPDTSFYLAGTSDVVAHLVLDHQTQMHNVITQANSSGRAWHCSPGRMQRSSSMNAPPSRWFATFCSQTKRSSKAPCRATPAMPKSLRRAGLGTPGAASLRDFDLRTRIFRYPRSYLIYTEAFDAIPETGEGVHPAPAVGSTQRTRSEPPVRIAFTGGSQGDSRNSGGYETGSPGRVALKPSLPNRNRSERKEPNVCISFEKPDRCCSPHPWSDMPGERAGFERTMGCEYRAGRVQDPVSSRHHRRRRQGRRHSL